MESITFKIVSMTVNTMFRQAMFNTNNNNNNNNNINNNRKPRSQSSNQIDITRTNFIRKKQPTKLVIPKTTS